jgi:hypothetical protein
VIFNGVTIRGSAEMRFKDVTLKAGRLDLSRIELPSADETVDSLPRLVVETGETVPGVLQLPPSPSDRIQLLTAEGQRLQDDEQAEPHQLERE